MRIMTFNIQHALDYLRGVIAQRRGWMDDAYPSSAFRAMLRDRGVRFVLNSDSHAAETLDCAFDRFAGVENFVAPLR